MKNSYSLMLAMVSAMLLTVGATRAAEKLDPLGKPNGIRSSTILREGPALPCVVIDDDPPLPLPPPPPPYDWPDGTLTEE